MYENRIIKKIFKGGEEIRKNNEGRNLIKVH
jgi:hypothetical protein